jgi:hypothetical protein
VAGQVQPFQNQHYMTLSKSALEQGFTDMKDRHNVGIHEFAHLLDEADGEVDGVPKAYLPSELVGEWQQLVERKMQEIKDGENKINPYAATSPAEFFAVMTEYSSKTPRAWPRTTRAPTRCWLRSSARTPACATASTSTNSSAPTATASAATTPAPAAAVRSTRIVAWRVSGKLLVVSGFA